MEHTPGFVREASQRQDVWKNGSAPERALPSGRLVQLEAEPRLEADGTRAQGVSVLSEVREVDIVVDASRVEVQERSEIEGVGANLKLRVFAEETSVGHAERLGD